MNFPLRYQGKQPVGQNCKIMYYPDGSYDQILASAPIFGRSGWELSDDWGEPYQMPEEPEEPERPLDLGGPKDDTRQRRRAKARIRQIARATPSLKYFVTFTVDPNKADRYDAEALNRRLNSWLQNQVYRRGLAYIVIPEYHKDGAIHWHGLINGALEIVDSGTMIPPEGGKPRRPRSKAARAAWLAAGGRIVYNLPGWGLGFSTAIELYGSRERAINYVAKYITKTQDKIGGRWYRHGGRTGEPMITYASAEFEAGPEERPIEIPDVHLQLLYRSAGPGTISKEELQDAGLWSSDWDS